MKSDFDKIMERTAELWRKHTLKPLFPRQSTERSALIDRFRIQERVKFFRRLGKTEQLKAVQEMFLKGNLIQCDGTSSPVDFSKPICDWSNSDNPWASDGSGLKT